jgi:hypothetical protein
VANLFSNIIKDVKHHTYDAAKSGVKNKIASVGQAVSSLAPNSYKDSGMSRFVNKYSADSEYTKKQQRRSEQRQDSERLAQRQQEGIQQETLSDGFQGMVKLQKATLVSLEKIRKAVVASAPDGGVLGNLLGRVGFKGFTRGGKVAAGAAAATAGVAGTAALGAGAAGTAALGAAGVGATGVAAAKGFNAFSKSATGISAAAKTAEVAGAGGGAAAKLAGKGALKGVGKTLLKGLPVIGVLAGIGFGINRLMKGDVVGAGLEFASGAAGGLLPPGAGLATVAALETALVARDVMKGPDTKGLEGSGEVPAASKESEVPTNTTPPPVPAKEPKKAEVTTSIPTGPSKADKIISAFGPKEAYAGENLEATKDPNWYKKNSEVDTSNSTEVTPADWVKRSY